MPDIYVHHRITTAPRKWRNVADELRSQGAKRIAAARGTLYGVWRSQIGRPRDELTVMTAWPSRDSADAAEDALLEGLVNVQDCESDVMIPTLRPDSVDPPRRQGNYAFRWFETPLADWKEFLDLCAEAWPGFESAYDSQVIGLWRVLGDVDDVRRSLLLTRRPNLAMWERSKIPQTESEVEVRRKLSRRYDLCDWTCVYTTTLFTAADTRDEVRWT
jgi:hypothetical protein